MYCASLGWTFEVIADLGSGMNGHTNGVKTSFERYITGRSRKVNHSP